MLFFNSSFFILHTAKCIELCPRIFLHGKNLQMCFFLDKRQHLCQVMVKWQAGPRQAGGGGCPVALAAAAFQREPLGACSPTRWPAPICRAEWFCSLFLFASTRLQIRLSSAAPSSAKKAAEKRLLCCKHKP